LNQKLTASNVNVSGCAFVLVIDKMMNDGFKDSFVNSVQTVSIKFDFGSTRVFG